MITFIFLSVILFTGCNQQMQQSGQEDERLNLVVSILPQKAFVEAVGSNLVNVKELIPPGESPETYEPKPSDLALVEKADIYFKIGHIPFEKSHADKFSELNPDMKIVDTSINVNLRYFEEHEEHTHDKDDTHDDEDSTDEDHSDEDHSDEEDHIDEDSTDEDHSDEDFKDDVADQANGNHLSVDPHIWLSPIQVKKQIDVIAQSLSQEDPVNADVYNQNAESFKKQLDKLHSEIELIFSELKTDKLMVFHPAWGYFADEYGLKQIAIEESGKEPTAQDLQRLIETAKEEEIKVIFVQSQFNKNIAESIAKEVGAIVVSINPLSEDYINNLKNIAVTIAENLS
jgi:zinc transport system substrate-binding protein